MGFISDGTATKLGDPGSMRDAGHGRNAVYVINAGSVPTLTKHQRSKVPKNWGGKDRVNNSIYTFGGKASINIKDQLK